MVAIRDVHLEVVENQGAVAALVTYRIVGAPEDAAGPSNLIESVELIGVDTIAGEDGHDEAIPDLFLYDKVTFPFGILHRSRLFVCQAGALDEDSGNGSLGARVDEIQARVMLARSTNIAAMGRSNIVRRGARGHPVPPVPD